MNESQRRALFSVASYYSPTWTQEEQEILSLIPGVLQELEVLRYTVPDDMTIEELCEAVERLELTEEDHRALTEAAPAPKTPAKADDEKKTAPASAKTGAGWKSQSSAVVSAKPAELPKKEEPAKPEEKKPEATPAKSEPAKTPGDKAKSFAEKLAAKRAEKEAAKAPAKPEPPKASDVKKNWEKAAETAKPEPKKPSNPAQVARVLARHRSSIEAMKKAKKKKPGILSRIGGAIAKAYHKHIVAPGEAIKAANMKRLNKV